MVSSSSQIFGTIIFSEDGKFQYDSSSKPLGRGKYGVVYAGNYFSITALELSLI